MTPEQESEIQRLRVAAAKAIRAVGVALVAADAEAPEPDSDDYEDWLSNTIGEEIADDSSTAMLTMAMTGDYETGKPTYHNDPGTSR